MFGAAAAIATMRGWFGKPGDVTFLESESGMIGDRLFLRYRYREFGAADQEPRIREQQAYASVEHGRVVDLAVLCSGSRPIAAVPQ